MSAIEKRNQYAAQILAGFAANPAIGRCLVNCTDGQIAAHAVRLANELFSATEAIDLTVGVSVDTSASTCARMPDKIEEKSCLYGGKKHCPFFKKGHPCCDCGATVSEGEGQ